MGFLFGWSAYRLQWVWSQICLWILVYWLELLLSGRLAYRSLTEHVILRAMRFGSWRRWWRRALADQFLLAAAYMVPLCIWMWLSAGPEGLTVRLTALCLLGVNLCLGNFVQCLLLLLTGSVRLTAGAMALGLAALLTLPPGLAAWYPFSWGMWIRSRQAWGYGFAVGPILLAEALLLAGIFLWGEKSRRGRR